MKKNIRERAIEELRLLFVRYAESAEMFGMYDEILEETPDDEDALKRREYYRDECSRIDSRIYSVKRVYGFR